jgi:hypothetical protein
MFTEYGEREFIHFNRVYINSGFTTSTSARIESVYVSLPARLTRIAARFMGIVRPELSHRDDWRRENEAINWSRRQVGGVNRITLILSWQRSTKMPRKSERTLAMAWPSFPQFSLGLDYHENALHFYCPTGGANQNTMLFRKRIAYVKKPLPSRFRALTAFLRLTAAFLGVSCMKSALDNGRLVFLQIGMLG